MKDVENSLLVMTRGNWEKRKRHVHLLNLTVIRDSIETRLKLKCFFFNFRQHDPKLAQKKDRVHDHNENENETKSIAWIESKSWMAAYYCIAQLHKWNGTRNFHEAVLEINYS